MYSNFIYFPIESEVGVEGSEFEGVWIKKCVFKLYRVQVQEGEAEEDLGGVYLRVFCQDSLAKSYAGKGIEMIHMLLLVDFQLAVNKFARLIN